MFRQSQIDYKQITIMNKVNPSNSVRDRKLVQVVKQIDYSEFKFAEPSVMGIVTDRSLQSYLAEVLTQRELQVASLVVLGYSNQQVADRLKVSEWNIVTHLRRIFVKLGVTSRTDMISCCAAPI
jgi:ATP/maltotriose-dependent transcriptional regulator MalT